MNKKLLCVITVTITLVLLGTMPAFGGDEEKPKLQRLSVKQLSALENSADTARASFFLGDYAAAEEAFQALAEDFNASQPLYKCELASVCLASGNEEEATDTLFEAYTALEGFIDPKLERSAAGIWGSETKKIYRGDPYEQSSLCLLLGLTFLENGDVDNALACFKTGQLADSDVTNELYTSDFGLLQEVKVGGGSYNKARGNGYIGVSHLPQIGPFTTNQTDILFTDFVKPDNISLSLEHYLPSFSSFIIS